ncbi:hypothetical protein A0H81_05613 [Grifola frondosa]|uniref:F-box domain-containing protein n=1 Tax=Grifola frondosa TaxID=5627 RepID=A0A1C7MCN3_GRIFR|nr:hypothetical protein A0H81_05613 [Grifola frondosa]
MVSPRDRDRANGQLPNMGNFAHELSITYVFVSLNLNQFSVGTAIIFGTLYHDYVFIMVIGMQSIHFCSLHVELVTKILLDVELHDLLAFKRVCRFLAELIANAMQLRYKTALGMAGLEDGPPGGLTTAERLERVEKYQDAWRDVSFSTSFPVLSRMAPGVNPKSHSGGVCSGLTATGDVELCQTGSPIRGQQEMHWMLTRGATGLAAMRICDVDCSQDLVVLFETRVPGCWFHYSGIERVGDVHLRSAASGSPHPLASRPTLGANKVLYRSSIHGDIVALVSQKQTPNYACSCGTGNPGSWCCTRLRSRGENSLSAAAARYRLRMRTAAPPFNNSVAVRIQFSRDSNPTRAVHGMPFQHRPAVRLLELSIGGVSASCYICFFLSAVHVCLQQALSTSQTWFAWEQWGPSGSRTLTFPYQPWYKALGTLGTKCLFLCWDSWPKTQHHLLVYEFNPCVVTGGPDAEQEAVVKDLAFAEPVCSRVRCRIDHWDEIPQGIRNAFLTEDGVVLTCVACIQRLEIACLRGVIALWLCWTDGGDDNEREIRTEPEDAYRALCILSVSKRDIHAAFHRFNRSDVDPSHDVPVGIYGHAGYLHLHDVPVWF